VLRSRSQRQRHRCTQRHEASRINRGEDISTVRKPDAAAEALAAAGEFFDPEARTTTLRPPAAIEK